MPPVRDSAASTSKYARIISVHNSYTERLVIPNANRKCISGKRNWINFFFSFTTSILSKKQIFFIVFQVTFIGLWWKKLVVRKGVAGNDKAILPADVGYVKKSTEKIIRKIIDSQFIVWTDEKIFEECCIFYLETSKTWLHLHPLLGRSSGEMMGKAIGKTSRSNPG